MQFRSAISLVFAILLASVSVSSQQLIDRQKALDAINALPAVAPPAVIKESCNADGTPNGVDEDQDGAVDENCTAAPPSGCVFTLGSTTATMPSTAATNTVSLAASPSGCSPNTWTATSQAAWISVGASGSGSAIVGYSVTANAGAQRTGTVTIAGQVLTITQAAAAVATGTYPSGWDDPRFVSMTTRGINSYNMSGVNERFQITTTSGEPMIGCSNFTARLFRIRGREGVRACSPGNILLEDGYVEATGSGSDHADGFQTYGGSSMPNIVLRRMHIKVSGADNAAFFAADNAGASFLIENSRLDGSNAPNGALFVANVPGDTGCKAMGLRNVELVGHVRFEGTCPITVWENVTLNGKMMNRPW